MPSASASLTVTGSSTAALPSSVLPRTPSTLTVKKTSAVPASAWRSSISSTVSSVGSSSAASVSSVASVSSEGSVASSVGASVSSSVGASVSSSGASVSTAESSASTAETEDSGLAASAKTLVGTIPISITMTSSKASIRLFIVSFPSSGKFPENVLPRHCTDDYRANRDGRKKAAMSLRQNITATIPRSNILTIQ